MRLKLDQVGLSGFEDFLPSQLSGGMKKRAAVARALAMDPEILFFDEPSAGLDPIIAAGIDQLILELKKAFHMTIIVVTHELASAYLIADRMVLINKGDVVAMGTVQEMQNSKHPKGAAIPRSCSRTGRSSGTRLSANADGAFVETGRRASGEEQVEMEARREQVFVGLFVLIATALLVVTVFTLTGVLRQFHKDLPCEVSQRGRFGAGRDGSL